MAKEFCILLKTPPAASQSRLLRSNREHCLCATNELLGYAILLGLDIKPFGTFRVQPD